jgi:hypothetical protein
LAAGQRGVGGDRRKWTKSLRKKAVRARAPRSEQAARQLADRSSTADRLASAGKLDARAPPRILEWAKRSATVARAHLRLERQFDEAYALKP